MKHLFLITIFLCSSFLLFAQDELEEGKFKVKGVSGFNLSQTALSNWSAGGDNSVAGTAYFTGSAQRKSGNWLWTNALALEYGLTKTSGQGTRKVGDKIDFSTQIGYSTNNKWFYTAMADFKTQFDKGYKYDGDKKGDYISKFMAPAYSNVSLGIEYRPTTWYSLYMSPAAGKFTYVSVDNLAKSFGLDEGDNFKTEFGTYLKGRIEREIMQNVQLLSTISFFSAYDSNFGNVDVDWDLVLSMKVNKFLSATINTTLKYDDDVQNVKKDGTTQGPRIQFKEVLGVGFSYNF